MGVYNQYTQYTQYTHSMNKPITHLNAPVEKLREDLQAAEFVIAMKDMDLGELQGALDWSQEWGDAMYDRAWKAEAGMADCEREMQLLKAELYRAKISADEAQRELKHCIANGMHTVHDFSDDSSSDDGVSSPISPLDLPKAIHGVMQSRAMVYYDTPNGPERLKPMADLNQFAQALGRAMRPINSGPLWGQLVDMDGKPSVYNPPTPIRYGSSSSA